MQSSWRGKSAVIGFFWAAAEGCDFVMVTRDGLETYTLCADRQARTHAASGNVRHHGRQASHQGQCI
jgi:hypothetical protein